MIAQGNYYIGYKKYDCPVAAVNADAAGAQGLAESLAEMVKAGYRVEHYTSLCLMHSFTKIAHIRIQPNVKVKR